MKAIKLTVIGMCIIFSSTVFATNSDDCNKPNDKKRGPPKFDHIDKNNNGKITLAEFKLHPIPRGIHKDLFNRIDTNNNGVISKKELVKHKPRKYKSLHKTHQQN